MSFKKLLADLATVQKDVLAKSTASDPADAAIAAAGATGGDSKDPKAGDSQAAAAAAGATGATGGDKPGATGGDKPNPDDKGGDLAKSFTVKGPDGEEFEAIDAGELLGNLQKSLSSLETDAGEALGVCIELIKSQQAQIDGLTASVRKLGESGTGRKAVLSVVQRDTTSGQGGKGGSGADTLAKGGQGGGESTITRAEFLAKSEQAFDAGKLNGQELGLIETFINRGEPVPAHLIQKVASAVSLTKAA
jgi:hypothetical protein